MKVKGHHVLLSLVCLVLGFMLSYSYVFTSKKEAHEKEGRNWDREYKLRTMLIDQEKENTVLERSVASLQGKVRKEEKQLAAQEGKLSETVAEAEQLRMYLGEVKVQGPGIEITLADSAKAPGDKNANSYIVHDVHVQSVLHELYAAGANGIAINGQRLTAGSYVTCNGPVITVDGVEHPAPFVIAAIGDAGVLDKALNIRGGVVEQLLQDNVIVKLQTKDNLVLEAYYEKTNAKGGKS
ncbi:DUF881 domain-containing protein [Ectobacillus ponti]|uniref:DUF881 domain-containing protein n=1 Tax=Ectobacillus ponti TaxID=2961894 RepID=A0AA42BQT7_9BACI|nr:DUF881 domain-containing protein [Ectobacillus ponti]MCP8970242.1 DUF881 domain-containing protein [Ectobacillus ponti]